MPRLSREKRTAESALKLRTHRENQWSGARGQWRIDDQFYRLEFKVWNPDGKKPLQDSRAWYHPARATSIVDQAVDNILGADPKVKRQPVGEGKGAKDAANRVEGYVHGVFVSTSLTEPFLTWKQGTKYLVWLGQGVWEGPVLDYTDAPTEPERSDYEEGKDGEAEYREAAEHWQTGTRYEWNPYRIRALHPAQVLLDPFQKQPDEALKVYMQSPRVLHRLTSYKKKTAEVYQGRKVYKVWEDSDDEELKVEVTELWNPETHLFIGNGEPLYEEVNTMGYQPIDHCYSGWGAERVDQTQTDPRDLAVGIYRSLYEVLRAQAQRASTHLTLVVEAGNAAYGTDKLSPEEYAELRARSDYLQGKKEDFWRPDPINLPTSIAQLGSELEDDTRMVAGSQTLSGGRDEGVITAAQHGMQLREAKKHFDAPAQQRDHIATIKGQKVLRCAEVLAREGHTLVIDGHRLSVKDIVRNYNLRVEFQTIDPLLQMEREKLGLEQMGAGALDLETYWEEYMGIEDTTKIKERLRNQRLESHPLWIAEDMAALAGERNRRKLQQKLEMEAQRQRQLAIQAADPLAAAGQNGASPNGVQNAGA